MEITKEEKESFEKAKEDWDNEIKILKSKIKPKRDIIKILETITALRDSKTRIYINIQKLESGKYYTSEVIKYCGWDINDLIKKKVATFMFEENPDRVIELNDIKKELDKELKYFRQPALLQKTLQEISKDHIGDDQEKMTLFCIALTSKLKPPKLRQSGKAVADTSLGKDNMIKSVLKHIPNSLYITSGTSATLQDDITNYDIVAFSELNMRENGANAHLIETIKQMSEGGTSALKKDLRYGNKVVRHERQEQKTIIYSTTQAMTDTEADTRFVNIQIEEDYQKIKKVNSNTLDWFSSLEKRKEESKPSWIEIGINKFRYNQVVIPYAKLLEDVFDNSDARSQRDVKRFLAIVSGLAYYYQLQREIKDNVIVASPIDFINAFLISKDFFNLTYKGVDLRSKEVLDIIDQFIKENPMVEPREAVPRTYIQEKLGKSLNTTKERIKHLEEMGILKWIGNFENQIPYYKVYQKGVKKPLISYQLKDIILLFNKNKLTPFDTFTDTLKNPQILKFEGLNENKQRVSKNQNQTPLAQDLAKNNQKGVCSSKIDTLELTPLEIKEEIIDDLAQDLPKYSKGNPVR